MPEYRCPFCLKKFSNSDKLAKHLLYDGCKKKLRKAASKR
jgi:hypothetical protein